MTDDPRKPPATWYTHPEMVGDDETLSPDIVRPSDGETLSAYWMTPSGPTPPTVQPWAGSWTMEEREEGDRRVSAAIEATEPTATAAREAIKKHEIKAAFRLGAYLLAGVLFGMVTLALTVSLYNHRIESLPAIVLGVMAGAFIAVFLDL